MLVYVCWKGGQFSDDSRLRNGHRSQLQSRHLYVQHVVRMQHSLQDETAVYHCHEQGATNLVFRFVICRSL